MLLVYCLLVNFVVKVMQVVLNLVLLCLGIILVVFLGKEILYLVYVLFMLELVSKYKLVEGLVVYFFYFEFIVLIVKYFEFGFYFLLCYFVYIGIIVIVWFIIVDYELLLVVFIYFVVILILVIMFWLCNFNCLKCE